MNITHRCLIVLSIAALCCACEDSATQKGMTYPSWPEQQVYTYDTVDCTGLNIPAEAITVKKALEIGKTLASGKKTTQMYYIKGLVKGFKSTEKYNHEKRMKEKGQAYVYIQDNVKTSLEFYGYLVQSIDNKPFTSLDQLQIGDFVVIYSPIYNYNGTIETGGSPYLTYSSNDLVYPEKNIKYVDEQFATGISHWNRRVVSGALSVDTWTANSGGITSAQANISGTQGSYPAGEVWLESPQYNLTKEGATSAKLAFQHAYKFTSPTTENVKDYLRVKVSKDGGAHWDDFEIAKFGSGTSKKADYVSDTIDISNYISDKTQIAFAYRSSATFAPKWNVSYVTISERKRVR